MSRQDTRRLETRRQIQEVARKLIIEHGYEKTTMRMLAKEAGVGLGTINLHFKDKQSLLLASFYDDIGECFERALATAPREGSVREQVLHIVATINKFYGSEATYLRSVVREALFVQGEWRERFDAQLQENVVAAAAMFESGKDRGEVKDDVDCLATANACWCLHLSVLVDGLNADVFDEELQLAKFASVLDVLLGGVLK